MPNVEGVNVAGSVRLACVYDSLVDYVRLISINKSYINYLNLLTLIVFNKVSLLPIS